MNSKAQLNVAVIGCVEFSEKALNVLIESAECHVSLVVTRASSAINSDFVDLSAVATKANIPFLHVQGNDQQSMADALRECQPDVIFCVGWSYLLKRQILDIPKYGVVGYHPAEIPHNRGRHPLIWAMVLGLEKTGSTFFLMDEGADTGKILTQEPIEIKPADYARDLYNSMMKVALGQIQWLVSNWQSAYDNAKPQQQKGNAWRKRGKRDGEIDWRMSAHNIINLVRALSEPYPGAHFEYQGKDYVVWRASEKFDVPGNLEPGKVLSHDENGMIVKCGENAIHISEFSELPDIKEGDYL